MRRGPLASRTPLLAALLLALPVLAHAQQADSGWQGRVHAPQYKETIFPPWRTARTTPRCTRGWNSPCPKSTTCPTFMATSIIPGW